MMNAFIYLSVIPALIEGQKYVQHTDIYALRNGTSGIITSPGYPGNYTNNANYTWTLDTGNPKANVTLHFTEFEIKKYQFTSDCEDYLQIEKIEPCCMLIIKRCGDFRPFNLEHTGKIFMITFLSDKIHNARGFKLSWRVYIPDTSTRTTTTTAQPRTTTTKTTTKMTTTTIDTTTTEQTTTTKPTKTMKTTESGITTTQKPITKKSTSMKIQTFTAALLTSNPTQTEAHTNGPFTKVKRVYVSSEKAHITQTLISTQSIIKRNNVTVSETLGTKEIIYLIAGIGVVELTLVALGIYIVKQRRANTRHLNTGKPDKEKNRPVSRKSVASVGNIYESIPMEHFSIKDAIPKEDESVYTEVPEHMYDKTFEHRPRVNVNANLYQLISELKTENR